MLAIHNPKTSFYLSYTVANAFAKLSKCQQFTTKQGSKKERRRLQTLLQSYQNVSNSQLNRSISQHNHSCKRFCKVIKMLAIHNYTTSALQENFVANAFAKLSKCQQFTTRFLERLFRLQLQTLLQSYQNVSNSQHTNRLNPVFLSCKRFCKVIKMLAIHNEFCFTISIFLLQTLLQSYQNVSNSQRQK